jgi:hypothetical protein
MTSIVDAESLLTLDIGAVTTRALLFDVVDGQYHFLAAGSAPSTQDAPFFDVAEGVNLALSRLQQITDRPLMDPDTHRIVIPCQADGTGVDRLAVTYSGGPELHIVAMGLLGDVSLDSVQRLASTTYGRLVEKIGLTDQRRQDEQLDALLACGPHLIILAGGTERGATRSVGKLVELVLLACKTMPKESRPRVLYCGNSFLAKRIQEAIGKMTEVQVAPNIRPSIDVEDLSPAMETLGKMVASLRGTQIGGLAALGSISSVPVMPTAAAMGRLVRFLSQLYSPDKGVLGLDLGASATTFAAASGGNLSLNVIQPLGMGSGLTGLLQQSDLSDITRWLPVDVSDAEVHDHLWQKTLYPAMLPMTTTALAIEQAAARQILRIAAQQLQERYGLGMSFEPIFAAGSLLAGSPSPMQSLMLLLDGLQPTGVTSLFLDPYGLMAALGAVAPANTVLPVQILESGAFINLAWVISPVSDARPGTVILRLRLEYEDGSEQRVEVRQGSLVPLPVRHGQAVKVFLKDAAFGVHVDPRLTRGGLKIYGGVCGAYADARGRPLILPTDAVKRRETLLRWSQAFEMRRAA